MTVFNLFISFFKIGLFSFGGGYAMIPLISNEITKHGWLSEQEFLQIIGIAEMTPGPIAINSATFVGYKVSGIIGSVAATAGVVMPSLLIILLIAKFFFKNSKHPMSKLVFKGIRPVIAGFIAAAAIRIARTAFISTTDKGRELQFETIFVMIVIFILSLKTKLHPIFLIILSGILGYGIYIVKLHFI